MKNQQSILMGALNQSRINHSRDGASEESYIRRSTYYIGIIFMQNLTKCMRYASHEKGIPGFVVRG